MHGPLRSRACWVYHEFYRIKLSPEHLEAATTGILTCLNDAELPVRLSAATSIHKMLYHKAALQLVQPYLENILGSYLKLMGEIDHEELLSALEELVDHFAEHIAPYAIKLTVELINNYKRLSKLTDEEDADAALTSVGCLCAVKQILKSVCNDAALLAQLELEVYPVVLYTLTPDGIDTVEEGIECLTLLLYYLPTVSEKLWSLFPHMAHVIAGTPDNEEGGYGYEFLHNMLAAFQNYLSKEKEVFVAKKAGETSYLELMWRMI